MTSSGVLRICTSVISSTRGYVIQNGRGTAATKGCPMTELRKHESDMNLARRYPVSVLITAPPDRALAIAAAISDPDVEDLVVHEIHGLNEAQQTSLLRLLETDMDCRRCRIIATTSTSLFDRVREGTFLETLFYRLNVIHIVSDSCTEGRGTSASSIIAA
jgi:hypothetical protein